MAYDTLIPKSYLEVTHFFLRFYYWGYILAYPLNRLITVPPFQNLSTLENLLPTVSFYILFRNTFHSYWLIDKLCFTDQVEPVKRILPEESLP